MQRLMQGYRRFRADRWPQEAALYEALAAGQAPRVLVITCADSRLDPAAIFDAKPGELFVVRNVANLVPPYERDDALHGTSAAVEFAVSVLHVKTILVLGHSQCGGCAAALDGAPSEASEFVAHWVEVLAPAREAVAASDEEPYAAMEREGVRVSLANLMTFPFVAARVARGELALEGARFDLKAGRLERVRALAGARAHVTGEA